MYALPAAIALALTLSAAALAPPATSNGVTASTRSSSSSTCQDAWDWVATIYYSDAAKTQEVGSCSITCRQFVDDDYPVFGGGGTCSGTSGPYMTEGFTMCGACRN